MTQRFIERGYRQKDLLEMKSCVLSAVEPGEETPSKQEDQLTFVTTYSPEIIPLTHTIKEEWKLIEADHTLPFKNWKAPRIGFRRGRNLRDHLVKADVNPEGGARTWLRTKKKGCYRCISCVTCSGMITGSHFRHPENNKTYEIKEEFCFGHLLVQGPQDPVSATRDLARIGLVRSTERNKRIGPQEPPDDLQSIGWKINFNKLPFQIRQKALLRLLMKRHRKFQNTTWEQSDMEELSELDPTEMPLEEEEEEEDNGVMDECLRLITQNANGTLNGKDRCVCEILLPDSTFPAKRVAALEEETMKMSNRVEDEMQKIEEQDIRIESHLEKLINLTKRIEALEKLRPEGLVEINFDLLKKEMKEMEVYVIQLRNKQNGSNTHVEILYTEVKNISKIVQQLETMDKNNVLKARRDMETLKKKLLDCEKNMKAMKPPVNIPLGSCQHSGLARISKPNLVQLNWKGSGYKFGAWGKDAAWNTTKKMMYYVAPLNAEGRILESVRVYPTLYDLQLYKNAIDVPLSTFNKNKWNHTIAGQGSGMVVYNHNLYYNCYNSRDMCRINLSSGIQQRKTLPNAVFDNRYSYAGSSFQYIDYSSDERGLWVIYTTEASAGNIIVGKINVATFTVEKSWTTTQYKSGVSNAFMICGILYATRSSGPRQEEIFYTFDTKTGKETHVSIILDKMTENMQSLTYNPNDRKLYMFDDGYMVFYDVILKP
ncbi:olfactomedin-like [Bombina bombina]|uniref:olfactomedin-like n=1 Tax=Bombina bombina TaxID=8345 RepID=UPI00235A817B|nr:olfactomedin-like [Bombina bombina]